MILVHVFSLPSDYQGKRILVRRHERRKARAAAAAEGGGGEVPAEEEEEEEELWLIKEYQAESGAYRMLVGQGDRYETHRLADLDFRVRDGKPLRAQNDRPPAAECGG